MTHVADADVNGTAVKNLFFDYELELVRNFLEAVKKAG